MLVIAIVAVVFNLLLVTVIVILCRRNRDQQTDLAIGAEKGSVVGNTEDDDNTLQNIDNEVALRAVDNPVYDVNTMNAEQVVGLPEENEHPGNGDGYLDISVSSF